MRKTNEEKFKEKVAEMLEQEKNYLEAISEYQMRIKTLNEKVEVRDRNVQDLQQQINSLNEKFESVFAPSTIREGVASLNSIMLGIDCKITQREIFKEFVRGVIKSAKNQIFKEKIALDESKDIFEKNDNEYRNFTQIVKDVL